MKLKYLALLISIFTLAFETAYAAPRSAAELLASFDSAGGAEFYALIPHLQNLGLESTPALESYALDTSKEGRNRMIVLRMVLDKRAPAAASKMLQDLLRSDPDSRFKAECATEMGRRSYPGAKELLKGILKNPKGNPEVQVGAALGLAEMGDDSGKERAVKAVIEKEPWANMAIRVLVKLKAADVIPRIEQVARGNAKLSDRIPAQLAVLRIKLAGKTPAEQLNILDTALRDKGSREVRDDAARHLADMGSPEAGLRLAAVAKDKDSDLAGTAVRGLRMGIERKAWTEEQVSAWVR